MVTKKTNFIIQVLTRNKKVTIFLCLYLAFNLLIYFANPYASKWHYQNHKPKPVVIETPQDNSMSVLEIETILDEIDFAYGAREPHFLDKTKKNFVTATQLIFFPSSVALIIQSFMGYMGPATPEQQAFTLSVKKRYNYLAKLGVSKGMQKKGFLFEEEPSLTKRNSTPY